jgi:hypothetical protein
MNSLPSKAAGHERYFFRLVGPRGVREIGHEELTEFAWLVGLKQIAEGRYSHQFVMDLLKMLEVDGVNPAYVVTEIKHIEHGTKSRTAAAEEFKHPPLEGLWHKHYFAARLPPDNATNEHGKTNVGIANARKNLSAQSEEAPCTPHGEIAREVVISAFEQGSDRHALTGEWIVFAKHDGKNYYLRACNHLNVNGDQQLYDEIEMLGFRQFPFLKGDPACR